MQKGARERLWPVTIDQDGRKMSKSLGNVIDPQVASIYLCGMFMIYLFVYAHVYLYLYVFTKFYF